MGGRKHPMHNTPFDASKLKDISDPLERDMMYRSVAVNPFCKYCGMMIMDSGEDEQGGRVDPEWEQQNKAHYICHTRHAAEERRKQAEAEEKRRREAEAFDWDAYMKKMTEGR